MKIQKLYNKRLNSYAIWNGNAWNDENISGAYFYSLEKAANNGYYPIEEKSDREQAIEWWNGLSTGEKVFYTSNYMNKSVNAEKLKYLYEWQIEEIYKKETQQELREDYDCCYPRGEQGIIVSNHKEIPQVDFEMLKRTINTQIMVLKVTDGTKYNENKEYENFKLFFNLLSKSSTFAHKAHKELKKLNTH